jgi:hypothetical protein
MFQFRIILSVLISLSLTQITSAAQITMSAGRVADQVVTSREVVINQMVENFLYRKTIGESARVRLTPAMAKERVFVRETTAVLLEMAVYLEAESFSQGAVDEKQVRANVKKTQSHYKRDSVWTSLQVSDKELEKMIRAKIRAKDFIKFKVDSATIPITDKEAEDYFAANRFKFESLSLENYMPTIKSYLTKQQVDKRLKDWFELLQSKYRIRNFLIN